MATDQRRMLRLEGLKALLSQREVVTAGELAAELGVTVRTVHRDLDLLREAGLPIEGERGRGGGLRLEQGWSLGRVHLNESEALGLLLSLTIAEKIGSPLLLDDLRSISRKVGAAFAPGQSRRILALRRRLLVGGSASSRVLATYAVPSPSVSRPLFEAFARQRLASVTYADRAGAVTEREVELQYLYYSLPVWYALVWDRLRDDVRALRLDRCRQVRVLDDGFRLRRADAFVAAGEATTRTI